VIIPPRLFAAFSWDRLELQLLEDFLRFGLGNTKVVVVKDTNSLDEERGGDAPILNAQEVLAVARVSWTEKL
jgi:hypothetical protein